MDSKAKLCKECKHFSFRYWQGEYGRHTMAFCTNPVITNTRIDLVTGDTISSSVTCEAARAHSCSQDGVYWEQASDLNQELHKEEKAWRTGENGDGLLGILFAIPMAIFLFYLIPFYYFN